MEHTMVPLLLAMTCVAAASARTASPRTFEIDYENDRFLKDGQPFRYISGSLHYWRVPREHWADRLAKMRAAGLNTVQTYVAWNMHQPQPSGGAAFSDRRDLPAFLRLAQLAGLLVVLRAGPYIDAERDMGGLPYWLLSKNSSMRLRTSDPSYLREVDAWTQHLLPMVRPFLYHNWGNVIMVQVENEYGSYWACDQAYLAHLNALYRKLLGPEVVLFSTDPPRARGLECGAAGDTFRTVDFGPSEDVHQSFAAQRRAQPRGPLVNSEFYAGWLDHWGEPHHQVATEQVTRSLDLMLSLNASVNFYMFHGGTNFGFENGANAADDGANYQPNPTSYDYDAPLSEAGDPTPKFFAIRKVIQKYTGENFPVPPASPKAAYGKVMMSTPIPLAVVQDVFGLHVVAERPRTFEQLGQDYGFVEYSHIGETPQDRARLEVPGLRDRAQVVFNGVTVGVLSRADGRLSIDLPSTTPWWTLSLLVENQGRVCFGTELNDTKGITSDVLVDGRPVLHWSMVSMSFNETQSARLHSILAEHLSSKQALPETDNDTPNQDPGKSRSSRATTSHSKLQIPSESTKTKGDMSRGTAGDDPDAKIQRPHFFVGHFTVQDYPRDTFLDVRGFNHGVAWVNGVNLGRYWPSRGPQVTLYVPAAYLVRGINKVALFETDGAPSCPGAACFVELRDTPVLNGTIH